MAKPSESIVGLTSNLDTEVGKVVVDLGLATRTEVDFCREQQKQASDPNGRSLADLLIENSFITVNQAKRIRGQMEERRSSQLPGYQVLGKLGKGAMATVYKARQVSLDRIVAVKILPRKMSDSTEFVDRFYKEGRAAARLAHNNIVQAIDVGSTPDGLHYFTMEYVEGPTLYDIMQPPPVGQGPALRRGGGAGHLHPDGRRPGPRPPPRADPPGREAQEHPAHPPGRGQADRPGAGPGHRRQGRRRERGGQGVRHALLHQPPSRSAGTWTSTSGPTSTAWARRCTT